MHRGIVDPVVAERSSASVSQFHDQVEALLLERRAEMVHDDPALAIDVSFRMAWGTLARQIMYGPTFESDRVVAWDILVAELGRACAAYLLVHPPPCRAHRRDRAADRTRRLTLPARHDINPNLEYQFRYDGPDPSKDGNRKCRSVCSPSWLTSEVLHPTDVAALPGRARPRVLGQRWPVGLPPRLGRLLPPHAAADRRRGARLATSPGVRTGRSNSRPPSRASRRMGAARLVRRLGWARAGLPVPQPGRSPPRGLLGGGSATSLRRARLAVPEPPTALRATWRGAPLHRPRGRSRPQIRRATSAGTATPWAPVHGVHRHSRPARLSSSA